MCGIYLVCGDRAGERVLEGLKRLEYRGYDSWGVAVIDQHQLVVEKHTGKIGGVDNLNLPGSDQAVGHTRWATHGGVTEVNAHPHLASDGSFALVQNGVVENYQTLKQELIDLGYTFISQTDTEVIVHLVEEERTRQGTQEVTLEVFAAVCRQLEGRSTVAVLTTTGRVFAFRDGSPLVVGRNERGDVIFSSDVLSLAVDAHEYAPVEHGQAVTYLDGTLRKYDLTMLEELELVLKPIDIAATKVDREGFAHFMLKEIFEQGQVLHRVAEQPSETWEVLIAALRGARHVYTLGAGSASFSSAQVAFFLRQQGIPATELKAYEARTFRNLFGPGDLCIAISQSGETADTNEVVEWMRERGVTIASLVNMAGSSLTAMSDIVCMLQVGPEVGVASTKALTGQMVWGWTLGQLLQGREQSEIVQDIKSYESVLSYWLNNESTQKDLHSLAQSLLTHEHLFILGRGQLYVSALEFALKMKEISYIHAEGFSGGELKHGVIALITQGTPIISLVTDDEEHADMLSAVAEVKARGGRTIGISPQQNVLFDHWLEVPEVTAFSSISCIIPAQLLTYYMALEKGLDPDKPRNLAKSVTVK